MSALDPLARDLGRLADALGGPALSHVLDEIAFDSKAEFEDEVRRAAGGDLTLSGWKRVKKITAGYEVDGLSAVFKARPAGAMAVLTSGRRPGSKRTRRGRRRSVSWGATRGRHTWDRAVLSIEKTLPERFERAARRAIEAILNG